MKTSLELDRVFPLAGGSSERARLRAPLLPTGPKFAPGPVMGNRAFMSAWAARRAQPKPMPPVPGPGR